MSKITSVNELIEILDKLDFHKYPKIIKSINIDPQILASYATWVDKDYTRNCLARSKKFELILLCWDGYTETPIHDHGGEDCWVYQIYGSVEEIRFACDKGKMKERHREKLTPGCLTFMNDKMGFHSLQNASDQRAMTLHIYASPINSCRIFNEANGCLESKTLTYDTISELKINEAVMS